MPGCEERFYRDGQEATVVKELGFDSAHFITDHPGKCSNLHGGHYAMKVKVKDRIDPATGFVLDYGYLKDVVKRRVVDRLDHQNLNYVSVELAWRSSTELLCLFIWERLIDYLPGMVELQIHETEQSYCSYTGPSLAEFQAHGQNLLLSHFKDPELGRSELRQQLINDNVVSFKLAGHNR
jgi:6-pyruvoyl tetrahydropterin synthase/QueD family protein